MFESVQKKRNQGNECVSFYPSINKLRYIQNILHSQTPLISIKEINKFRQLVAKAALGEYFLIQLGACAESLYQCDKDSTHAKLSFIRQLSDFFQKKTEGKVLQVGGISDQYVECMNNSYEIFQNKRIYPYFDDMTNQLHKKYRYPDPWRMLLSYSCSASIYKEIHQWNCELKSEEKIYTSHEASLLHYEYALTRLDKCTGLYYNRSAHLPWLDKHTLQSHQHINYLKNIANPIAVKVGPDTPIKKLIKIIKLLDPDYLPGRITLIPRLGARSVQRILPQLIEEVEKTKRNILWSCDPMHGNTEISSSGTRIRRLSNIVEEINCSFLIHRKMGSQLNAIHLEATHQDIMECMNYESTYHGIDLNKNYKSLPDPRLNFEQTVHVIQHVARNYIDSSQK